MDVETGGIPEALPVKASAGGWKAAPFIIVNEVAERMTFYAIAINLTIFLRKEMHEELAEASNHVNNWIGSAFILTIVGGFIADSYLGRFLTIVIFSSIYALGSVLLTVAASIDSFRPPPCDFGVEDCQSATLLQNSFLFGAISLIAIGTGGIKPCISSFGADQFADADPNESRNKSSFFNWFFFAISFGSTISITLIAYIEERKKYWGWGFGVSAAANVASFLTFLAGMRFYRHQKPKGSTFTRFLQAFVSACRNNAKEVKVKVKSEELKSLVRVLPIWATTIAFPFAFAQISFFVSQGMVMDRRISEHMVVPPGSVAVFATVNALFFIPLYERFLVPLFKHFTGHRRGLSSLQRVGIGLFITIPTFAIAALVERHRRSSAEQSKALTFWWLSPQYFLLGIAEMFTYVGQLEFFYEEATDATRSVSSAVFLSAIGVGNWLSALLVKIVGRGKEGWLSSDLDRSKLDYYYWVVCGINAVNFCIFFAVVARFYKGDCAASGENRDEVESYGLKRVAGEE